VEWRLRAIRGATTVSENTVEAIREALIELLDEIEARNQQITTTEIISVTFSVTRDLNAFFQLRSPANVLTGIMSPC
jgi:chorismate mutase